MTVNGNSKWYATTIITILLCILTFMGGRWSVSAAISDNAAVNGIQTTEINNIKEVYRAQSIKIDEMYRIIMEWSKEDTRRPTGR